MEQLKKPMDNEKKVLKIYGILLLVLAVIDLLMVVLDLLSEGDLLKGLSSGEMIFIAVIYILGILVILIKVWLGRQALSYAAGKGKGKSHITFAKIGIVLYAFIVASGIISVITGDASLAEELAPDIVSLTIIICYYKSAKAVYDSAR